MGPHDKRRFAELMTMIAEVYGKEITQQKLALWFDLLGDCDIAELERAAREHMLTSKFMPTPAELIERMHPAVDRKAMLAWAEVPILLRNSRYAKSPDPVTEKVVQDLGGWFALGQKTTEQLVWVAKEFAQRYEMYSELGVDVKAIGGPRNGLRLIGNMDVGGGS
jgi:hypothetical protein